MLCEKNKHLGPKALVWLKEMMSILVSKKFPNYERNCLRANPDKTQACAFHLKNREASRKLNITRYNKRLEHIPNPIFLRVTLDRTLSDKEPIHKLKCNISAWNNILKKLSNRK